MRLSRVLLLGAAILLLLGSVVPASAELKLSSPVLLTSAGQSPDVVMAKVLLAKVATVNMKQVAKEADLAGNKTLVVVIGASSKGLGAAGIDLNEDTQRVKKLTLAARAAGMKVVAMHIGGSARRGASSNQLIEAVVPQADAVIVVASGNSDKIFNKELRDGAAFYSVAKIADCSVPLSELFGK